MDLGRPTKYKDEYDNQVYKMTLLGLIDRELAKYFEIAESTLNVWKIEHPSFAESIKNGKDKADAEIVMSLRKKAMGYQYIETTVDGERVKTVDKHMPADTASIIYWLNNRQKDKWKNRQEVINMQDDKLIELLDAENKRINQDSESNGI